MIFDFLTPISEKVLSYALSLPENSIGSKIIKNTGNYEDLNLTKAKIAIFTIGEYRGNQRALNHESDLDNIRFEFYNLKWSNWNFDILDLGHVNQGYELKDSYKAVEVLCCELLKMGVMPVIIGGSHDLTYANYRAYDSLEQVVNLACVDSKFNIGDIDLAISSDSFLSHIVLGQPTNLFNFANIGYQTYFNSSDEIELMDKLYFDTQRLGLVNSNSTLVEPILRDSDIVSIDMSSVRHSDSPACVDSSPNGLFGEQICSIARYAGISDKVSSFGVYEYISSLDNRNQSAALIGQILWYFIEGVSLRTNDYPFCTKDNYTKYIVPVDQDNLYFYRSNKSDRWWLDVPYSDGKSDSIVRHSLIPCSYDDYLKAADQEIPDRYWKAFRKLL